MFTEFWKYVVMTMMTNTLIVLLHTMNNINHLVYKPAQQFHTDITNQIFVEFSHGIT